MKKILFVSVLFAIVTAIVIHSYMQIKSNAEDFVCNEINADLQIWDSLRNNAAINKGEFSLRCTNVTDSKLFSPMSNSALALYKKDKFYRNKNLIHGYTYLNKNKGNKYVESIFSGFSKTFYQLDKTDFRLWTDLESLLNADAKADDDRFVLAKLWILIPVNIILYDYNGYTLEDAINSTTKYIEDGHLKEFSNIKKIGAFWGYGPYGFHFGFGPSKYFDLIMIPYDDGGSYGGSWNVYNNFSSVTYWSTLFSTYKLHPNKDIIREEIETKENDLRNSLFMRAGCTYAFLVLFLCYTLWDFSNKRRILNETLKCQLLRECNPKIFIKKFNKEKIDISNTLYNRLISTESEDSEMLIAIASEAEEKLGVTLVKKDEVRKLKKRIHPKNFLKEYNSVRVKKATEFYDCLSNKQLRLAEFYKLQLEINSFLNAKE